MEYTTIQKNISDSPRKLRLVADMIRKMKPEQALEMLSFTNKAAATPLSKAIKTALANASSPSTDRSGNKVLGFKKIEINEGMKMKRNRVGTAGRGRSRPYKRRMSHIKIVLTDEIVVEPKSQRSQKKEQQILKPSFTKASADKQVQDDTSSVIPSGLSEGSQDLENKPGDSSSLTQNDTKIEEKGEK